MTALVQVVLIRTGKVSKCVTLFRGLSLLPWTQMHNMPACCGHVTHCSYSTTGLAAGPGPPRSLLSSRDNVIRGIWLCGPAKQREREREREKDRADGNEGTDDGGGMETT